ncbi:FAD-binding oxidoreductase [Ramlibacter sp. AN1015]|uniref:NAD(P)/FAD-dependent oxidoreductase n=1 Tax=Ramlibacter sp. AN1015 TaxID=3133428 RepID=UPI0030C067FE
MQQYPDSWWAASARQHCAFPALAEDTEVDVAIVGGGFTGLSAAHHLQRAGLQCAVLEANRIGWGASGRNGGIAVPRYKWTYPELERKYGFDVAALMYRSAHDALDTLESIVRSRGLDCGFARTGHLTPVVSASDVPRFSQDVQWLASRLADTWPRVADEVEAAQKTGTSFYTAAYLEPRGAVIHPLEYCITLAKGLHADGVKIHCDTPVLSWACSGDAVVIQTSNARVRARQLLLATNAYSDLTPAGKALAKRVVPVASAVIATEPLPEALRSTILPDGEAATDAKRLTNYYRVLRDGSFFFGGRGGASSRASQRIYDRLRRDMLAIYPQLESVRVRHQWFGLVAVTLDTVPHIGSLQARVHYGMGYNGRGVALAALFGRKLAQMALGDMPQLGPMSEGSFQPIPFHAFRVPAKQVVISWKQLVDSLGV